MLRIGATVKVVKAMDAEETRYVGMIGTLMEIEEHHEDGDFYGVNFPPEPEEEGSLLALDTANHRVFFWAEELEVIEEPK